MGASPMGCGPSSAAPSTSPIVGTWARDLSPGRPPSPARPALTGRVLPCWGNAGNGRPFARPSQPRTPTGRLYGRRASRRAYRLPG